MRTTNLSTRYTVCIVGIASDASPIGLGISIQQKRDSYEQARREREEEELQRKKQIQREKVSYT